MAAVLGKEVTVLWEPLREWSDEQVVQEVARVLRLEPDSAWATEPYAFGRALSESRDHWTIGYAVHPVDGDHVAHVLLGGWGEVYVFSTNPRRALMLAVLIRRLDGVPRFRELYRTQGTVDDERQLAL